jgi:glycosyltransferase involved in cell wall biosynthesis
LASSTKELAHHHLDGSLNHAPISVIVPCYRCAEKVYRAVDSVARQQLKPNQVILVDDGSGDDTLQSLYVLQSKYGSDWIKVIESDVNRGAGYARNIAWQHATQEYLAFLDADDIWHPKKLAIQYDWMCQHANAVLTGHRYKVGVQDLNPKIIFNHISFRKVTPLRLLLSNYFPTPTVMIKRNTSNRFQSDKRFSEDYLLWLKICLGGGDCYQLDLPLAFLDKAEFGVSGMSANLWKMELGELDAYRTLYREKDIDLPVFCLIGLFSWLKFIRRLIIVYVRNLRSIVN